MKNKVQIIAEAGLNHNGQFDLAIKLIDIACEAGTDTIKFQTSIPKLGVSTKYMKKANYQLSMTDPSETFLEMCERMHLPLEDYEKLKAYSEKQGIQFLSTPFDIVSIKHLDNLGVECFKIPSGEITDIVYLREIGRLNKYVIMSTGMAKMSEVKNALNTLITSGTEKSKITVLHCNTAYPTPYEDVNLRAMLTIRDELGVQVGYSDHTLGIEVPIAAVALGATVIEKHITLNRNMPGPDHHASLEPEELKSMVQAIRNIEKTLGDGIKRPSPSELENKPIARKSIFAAKTIKKGEKFSQENMIVKRPGIGISPIKWDEVVGKIASKNFEADDLIEL